jgi:molecular chaperone DnaK (HSP70)
VNEIIIGIDLGTTNSEVAIVRDGQPFVIDVDGSKILPSVVGLADDGNLLVGQAARNQWVLHPDRTIRSIKRRMGQDIKVSMGSQEYTPQEISALILKRLRKAAEEFLGQEINKAVITVPAYFSDAQRQATRDAGELAGLEVVRIINEPTAAALAYEVDHTGQRTILVYDLGGGTFDVSVVKVEQDVTEVLASHGNNFLGGDDFDAKIIEHLVAWLKRERNVDPSENRVAMARLRRAAETAKIALSNTPYVRVEEEYLLEHEGQPIHLSLELSRIEYENMIIGFINETIEAIHTALRGANLAVRDINEILLVGGATRTPLIQEKLEQELGMQPRSEVDPDLCVAAGASIQAAVIGGQKVSSVLVDITPYTFGTSALGELNGQFYQHTFVPLIRKNTAIPITKSESFSTVSNWQSAIEVKVYQGEDPDALNNIEIGSFVVEGLSKVPAGNTIILTFSLDFNGILQVTAREKRTGLEKQIRIDNAMSRFKQSELTAAKKRIAALVSTDDDAEDQIRRDLVQTQALLEKAQRLIEKVSADDREDLINLVEKLNDAQINNSDELETVKTELTDLIFYLEN